MPTGLDAQGRDEQRSEIDDLIAGSYKRPKRQKAAEPLHPCDERKIQTEKARFDMETRE